MSLRQTSPCSENVKITKFLFRSTHYEFDALEGVWCKVFSIQDTNGLRLSQHTYQRDSELLHLCWNVLEFLTV